MIPGLKPSFVPTAPMKTSRPIPPPRLFRCRAYVRLVKKTGMGRLICLAGSRHVVAAVRKARPQL